MGKLGRRCDDVITISPTLLSTCQALRQASRTAQALPPGPHLVLQAPRSGRQQNTFAQDPSSVPEA